MTKLWQAAPEGKQGLCMLKHLVMTKMKQIPVVEATQLVFPGEVENFSDNAVALGRRDYGKICYLTK